ncbi:MAG: AAA family ATPase [Thermodesulfobacteriota bacterium]
MNKTTGTPVIIAVCGKGGVGKTSISALLVAMFAHDPGKKVLAIDADPAVGLSGPLGIGAAKTIDDIRNQFIADIEKGANPGKEELIRRLDYEIMSALSEKKNLAFLAIGRPESEGCYCSVNSLLRDIIRDTAQNFDIVVIDGEAGMEQINRRVMETVTHLFLVTDASSKARSVAAGIEKIARRTASLEKAGIFFNRIRDKKEADALFKTAGPPVIGWMAENSLIRELDREGKSFFDNDRVNDIPFPQTGVRQFLKI